MKKKIFSIIAALGIVLGFAVVAAPTASAYQSGNTIFNHQDSVWPVWMEQTYIPQSVSVTQGHWNTEFGRTDIGQSVNRFYLGPHTCITVYRPASAGGWLYVGEVATATGEWITPTINRIVRPGTSLIVARRYFDPAQTPRHDDCYESRRTGGI